MSSENDLTNSCDTERLLVIGQIEFSQHLLKCFVSCFLRVVCRYSPPNCTTLLLFFRKSQMKLEEIADDGDTPKVLLTVITPVFNGERYIEETINSVLTAAKGFLIDYVIIDDGSSDATPEIIKKFSGRLRSFHQENRGEAAAVNFGIEKALGRYCIIVNYDDPIFTSDLF